MLRINLHVMKNGCLYVRWKNVIVPRETKYMAVGRNALSLTDYQVRFARPYFAQKSHKPSRLAHGELIFAELFHVKQ